MQELFNTNINFITVEESSNEFIKIKSEISKKFEDLIEELEKNSNVILCLRGESKNYDKFLSFDMLKKFFIVGQKVNAHIRTPKEEKYKHIDKLDRKELLIEINEIIREVNVQIKNNPHKRKPLKGEISSEFVKNIADKDMAVLNKIKIFFLAYLHNSYKNKLFNSITPFLSMAKGSMRFEIAKYFALNKGGKNNGYIFLYSLCTKVNKNIPEQYIITEKFIKILKSLGIENLDDRYSEIMLLNGMYPHYLLGIIKIEARNVSEFIMNPSLFNKLKNDEEFDFENGLPINQKNFMELAKELEYQTFFYTNGENTFVSDLFTKYVSKNEKI